MTAAGAANDAFHPVQSGATNKEIMQYRWNGDMLGVLKDILHRPFSFSRSTGLHRHENLAQEKNPGGDLFKEP